MNAAQHLAPFAPQTQTRAATLVFWSASTMEVDPLTMLSAMREHLPDHADLVREPVPPHTAITRAMRRCKAGLPSGYRWERIGVDGDEAIVALISEAYDTEAEIGRRVSSGDVLAVRVAKSGALTVDAAKILSADERAQVERLGKRYHQERGLLTHQDLSGLMKTIILDRCRGIRVKDGGAVYLVPSPHDGVIAGLAEAMRAASIEVVGLPMFDEQTLSQFKGAASASLLDEAEALATKARERLASVQADAQAVAAGEKARPTTRASTLEKRLEDAQDLRNKANLYRDLLGIAVAEVEAAADMAEETIRQALYALVG